MASVITPAWSDNITFVAAQVLAPGNSLRATYDLTSCVGARMIGFVGRSGTTALSTGCRLLIRPTLNADTLKFPGGNEVPRLSTITAAIVKQINNGAGYAAGVSAWVLDGTGTPANDDIFFQWGTATDPTSLANAASLGSTWEIVRARSFASVTLTMDSVTKRAVSDNYYLTNKCDVWDFVIGGGCMYEILFDYYDSGSAQNLAIGLYGQVQTGWNAS